MSWDAFLKWRGETAEIADATTHVTTLLMDRAPGGSDVFEYMATAAPVVLSSYAQSSQDAAVGYVKSAHRSAGLSVVPWKPTAAVITAAMLEPVVKWALTDVVMPWAMEEVLPKVVQGATRLVTNVGRETVSQGIAESPEEASWRRVPSADACAYCRMMSQWTYSNRADASRTVARYGYYRSDRHEHRRFFHPYLRYAGIDENGEPMVTPEARAARGSKQGPGSPFHGNCRCEPIAMFGANGMDDVPEEYQLRWESFTRQWDDAYARAGEERATQREALREEIYSRVLRPSEKRDAWKAESRELPNQEQIALAIIRGEHGAR
ncbi:hypothetical protein [Brachybacterium sp. GU-2]|uniref:VG15 protein n=1 Tax=Brachybacterium sp. GU-2 TaxID=3069708 RepID=UPI00280ADD29|nr:hypothetical protein [Brachybacterium sp. GU-2]WME22141.1 hypothetical protein RBL05_11405 [Brachybacterium sp. GU-2]